MRESIQVYYSHYFNFTGRISRREYWRTVLFLFMGTVVLTLFSWIFFVNALLTLWFVVNLIPSISLLARRLHDRNLSAWVMLAAFIPGIGTFILLFLSVLPGTQGFNRFGPATDSFYGDSYYSKSSEQNHSYNCNSQRDNLYDEETAFSGDDWDDF